MTSRHEDVAQPTGASRSDRSGTKSKWRANPLACRLDILVTTIQKDKDIEFWLSSDLNDCSGPKVGPPLKRSDQPEFNLFKIDLGCNLL